MEEASEAPATGTWVGGVEYDATELKAHPRQRGLLSLHCHCSYKKMVPIVCFEELPKNVPLLRLGNLVLMSPAAVFIRRGWGGGGCLWVSQKQEPELERNKEGSPLPVFLVGSA